MGLTEASLRPYLAFFLVGPWIWILGWVAASIAWRRSRGLPIFGGTPDDALFFEGSVSGNSQKNLFTALFHANGCLRVVVTPDLFIVRPFFPFNLMFLPNIGDLEHYVPRGSVRLQIGKRFLFSTRVRVSFPLPDGRERGLLLSMKDPQGLAEALGRR